MSRDYSRDQKTTKCATVCGFFKHKGNKIEMKKVRKPTTAFKLVFSHFLLRTYHTDNGGSPRNEAVPAECLPNHCNLLGLGRNDYCHSFLVANKIIYVHIYQGKKLNETYTRFSLKYGTILFLNAL